MRTILLAQLDERRPRRDGLSWRAADRGDDSRARRLELVLHLHGLDDHEALALLDALARRDEHGAARPGHGRLESGIVRGGRALSRLREREPPRAPLVPDEERVAVAA